MCGLNLSIREGTITFLPSVVDHFLLLQMHYPDCAGCAYPRSFRKGASVTLNDVVGVKELHACQEALLEALCLAEQNLLRHPIQIPPPDPDEEGLLAFYHQCGFWNPSPLVMDVGGSAMYGYGRHQTGDKAGLGECI